MLFCAFDHANVPNISIALTLIGPRMVHLLRQGQLFTSIPIWMFEQFHTDLLSQLINLLDIKVYLEGVSKAFSVL